MAFLELPLTPFSTSVAMTVSIDGAMVGNDADVMHGSFIRFSGVGWSALVRQCLLRRKKVSGTTSAIASGRRCASYHL